MITKIRTNGTTCKAMSAPPAARCRPLREGGGDQARNSLKRTVETGGPTAGLCRARAEKRADYSHGLSESNARG